VGTIAKLLSDEDSNVRRAAIEALGKLGQVGVIVKLLSDKDVNVRRAAIEVLGKLGAKEQVGTIAKLLSDEDGNVRRAAIEALMSLDSLPLESILPILELGYQSKYDVANKRYLAHFLAGGDKYVETAIAWLGNPKSRPQVRSGEEVVEILEQFQKIWPLTQSLPDLRKELARQITHVALIKKGRLGEKGKDVLEDLKDYLEQEGQLYISQLSNIRLAIDAEKNWVGKLKEKWEDLSPLEKHIVRGVGVYLSILFLGLEPVTKTV